MTQHDDDNSDNHRGRENQEADYNVGYGKPPKHSQFKTGKSGNPRGRPKGTKEQRIAVTARNSLAKMVLRLGRKKIKVNDASGEIEIETIEAMLRTLQLKGLKGDVRALSKFIHLFMTTENAGKDERQGAFETVLTYKTNKNAEIEQRKAAGETNFSDIIPHPDHIHINVWAGTAYLVGPLTPEEKKDWDWYRTLKEDTESSLPELEAEAESEKDPRKKRTMVDQIKYAKTLLKLATQFLSLRRSLVPDENGELEVSFVQSETKKARRRTG